MLYASLYLIITLSNIFSKILIYLIKGVSSTAPNLVSLTSFNLSYNYYSLYFFYFVKFNSLSNFLFQ